ncbi:MAG: ATP-binding protein/SpoIIE family protein phosphatase [Desulfomonile sp.]|nr:ATP-binding protein/SpoIIE family protein phosphatase [Desulfomonile sp.]
MEITLSFRMSVTDRSAASEARREAERVASKLGFGKADIGSIAIIVTEVAKNLAKYATKGELIIQTLQSEGRFGIELTALDQGPGMANPSACLQDGFSTGGSPGTGLGAIKRLSSLFDVFSVPGQGTAILSRFWSKASKGPPKGGSWEIGALCVPKPGQTVSGDGCAWKADNLGLRVIVTDGLGHGPLAANASLEAIKGFHSHAHLSLTELLKVIHDALRSTRGAAVGLAHVYPENGIVRFVGVGNIAGVVIEPSRSRNMVSHNGTVGSELRKIQEFEYPWSNDATLIMYSDGISSRWNLDAYPGLIKRHPSLVAGVLYRDHGRGTDDSTIVVIRQSGCRRSGAGSQIREVK